MNVKAAIDTINEMIQLDSYNVRGTPSYGNLRKIFEALQSPMQEECACLQHHKVHAVNCPNYAVDAGESLAKTLAKLYWADEAAYPNKSKLAAYVQGLIEQARKEGFKNGTTASLVLYYDDKSIERIKQKAKAEAIAEMKEKFEEEAKELYKLNFGRFAIESMHKKLFGTEGKS